MAPWISLIQSKTKLRCKEDCDGAFENVKLALIHAPNLTLPKLGMSMMLL